MNGKPMNVNERACPVPFELNYYFEYKKLQTLDLHL
jgi:hypothetical protein